MPNDIRSAKAAGAILPKLMPALLLVVATLALGAARPAAAETTAETLTRIEAETLVLKAREKQLEVQVNILNRQNEMAAKQNVGNVITAPVVVGDPVVRAVEGLGKNMFATLQMNDGSMVDVQNGSVLANGMRVTSIASNAVMVQTGKNKPVRLSGSSNAAGGDFNPNFPASGVSIQTGNRGAAK
jgi:type IV pilus biogenesis protein PilP